MSAEITTYKIGVWEFTLVLGHPVSDYAAVDSLALTEIILFEMFTLFSKKGCSLKLNVWLGDKDVFSFGNGWMKWESSNVNRKIRKKGNIKGQDDDEKIMSHSKQWHHQICLQCVASKW